MRRLPRHKPASTGTDGRMVGGQAQDFSGLDFRDLAVDDQNFFESIFNGCTFQGFRSSQSIFQHAEFTETNFRECVVEDTSFDHADFVLAELQDCVFTRCSFQNGEWRDTVFRRVTFRQCIFRNTTTSLIRFVECSFDDASAASFVGTSKRFSLFSNTAFRLPTEHVEFLLTNYGLTASDAQSVDSADTGDALFDLAKAHYRGDLPSKSFYSRVTGALATLVAGAHPQQRLELRYLVEICRLWLDEERLSIFGIRLLEATASRMAASTEDRDHALELVGLVFSLRLALRNRLAHVDARVAQISMPQRSRLQLKLEFENTYDRGAIEKYLSLLRNYCRLSDKDVTLAAFAHGSTIVDVVVASMVSVPELFRFIGYSLSLATMTVRKFGQLKRAYSDAGSSSRKSVSPFPKSTRRSTALAKARDLSVSAASVASEMVGTRPPGAGPIEVFVDTAKERVLVVDGRVRVTILLT